MNVEGWLATQRGNWMTVEHVVERYHSPIPMRTFNVGDRVKKSTGDYHLIGNVRAAFLTGAGKLRYVVEDEHYPGMLMIYAEDNLIPWQSTVSR